MLDICYTGKAFAGLVRRAREGFYKPGENVLFVHTGGNGGLFAQDWEMEELRGIACLSSHFVIYLVQIILCK